MIILDTDILTLFAAGDARVTSRAISEIDTVAITIINRIEVLRGRFDALVKAPDGQQLEKAQQRLVATERGLAQFVVLPIDAGSAAHIDELRKQGKLKKIGRVDLLIASIVLAHNATLVTCNLRHFRQVPGLNVENWAD